MEQKEILKYLGALMDTGYQIKNVNWDTGEISVIPPKFPVDALTNTEIAACNQGKIYAIKEIRRIRGIGLADAKALAEKYFDFESGTEIK